jgi:hypothetical protein
MKNNTETYPLAVMAFVVFCLFWTGTSHAAITPCEVAGGECVSNSCGSGKVESNLICGAGTCCMPDGNSTTGRIYKNCSECLETQNADNCKDAGYCTQSEINAKSNTSTPAGCAASGGTWDAQIGTCGWTTGGGTGTGTGTGSGTGSGTVSTQVKCDTSSGFEEISGVCVPTTTGLSDASIGRILSNLFVWLMAVFMILGVMAFVISGIQYLVSAGDEGMIETAKRNAKWSLVGVIVGLSGYVIIQAISTALSGQGFFF